MEQRDEAERNFFAGSNWTELDLARLGVPTLTNRLAKLLYQHVLAAIPGL